MAGEFIECQVCGKSMRLLTNSHLKTHNMSPSEYKVAFPGLPLASKKTDVNNRRARKEYATSFAARQKTSLIGKRNKGKKRTQGWCAERSSQYAGEGNPFFNKTHSLETRQKLSAHFQGVGLDGWEDFSSDEHKRAWKSKRAKRWSQDIFKRDDYTCALCAKRGGDLEAHHIIRRIDAPELTYDLNNGITLCVSCHREITGAEAHYKERFKKMVTTKNSDIGEVPSKVLKSLL